MKYEIIAPAPPPPPPPTVVRLEVPSEAVRYLRVLVGAKTRGDDRAIGFDPAMTGALFEMLLEAEVKLP